MYKLALIAAIANNNAIGNKNKLIYWLPNDLRRFKALTTGHTIIMGSNTFRSLPKGALPNRRNIVLSRKGNDFLGAEHYASLEEALESCKNEEIVYVIGGEMLYRASMPHADMLCLTEVADTPAEADAFFPDIDKNVWKETERENHKKDEKHEYDYSFVTYSKA
ncbi:MAG: dihydrofolate reductase [Bacteroidaceae bacterium]|nr:dihydrofolate reductase [Bacteroidaceae bacterium]